MADRHAFPLTAGENRFPAPEKHPPHTERLLYIIGLATIGHARRQRNFWALAADWQRNLAEKSDFAFIA